MPGRRWPLEGRTLPYFLWREGARTREPVSPPAVCGDTSLWFRSAFL